MGKRYKDRFEMYADEERREERRRHVMIVLGFVIAVVACVTGFMSCTARMDACEKAGISFWLCFDESTRLLVPLDDGADHTEEER